jgi:hypothetical protein
LHSTDSLSFIEEEQFAIFTINTQEMSFQVYCN